MLLVGVVLVDSHGADAKRLDPALETGTLPLRRGLALLAQPLAQQTPDPEAHDGVRNAPGCEHRVDHELPRGAANRRRMAASTGHRAPRALSEFVADPILVSVPGPPAEAEWWAKCLCGSVYPFEVERGGSGTNALVVCW